MAWLNQAGATGTLAIRQGSGERELLFVDGELRAARSTCDGEKLGSWLVGRGRITEEEKQLTLLSQGGTEAPPLGHLLVQRGLIDRNRLEQELELLALKIIERASGTPRSRCSFTEGAAANQPDTLPNLTTQQLVLHAARSVSDVEAMRSTLGASDGEVRLARRLDDLVHEAEFELAEAVLLGKLHRPRTLAELESLSTLASADFVRALYGLLLAGVASCSGARFPGPDGAHSGPETENGGAAQPSRGTAPDPRSTSPEQAGRRAGATVPRRPTVNPEAERGAVQRLATSVSTQDHYAFLGLNPSASYQAVFDAWEEFNTRFHPDRASEAHLKDLRRELVAIHRRAEEAFDTLSSPQKRPLYDRISRTRKPSSARTGEAPAMEPAATSREEARASLIRANLRRADELIRAGEVFPAIRLLEQVCVMEPSPEPLLKLARLMLINPQWGNRALEKLRQALELDPEFVDGWLEVAEFWRRRRHRERQRKALERAVAADPNHEVAAEKYRTLVGEAELRRLQQRARASRGRPGSTGEVR